jgi:TIR domain
VSAGPEEEGSPPARRVFISYRRQDSAAYAGRVYDAMVDRFGERKVFMDLDLAPGVDFVERITEAVSACQVLIEVIGPTWAGVKNDEGEVRIAAPEDFVRLELEIALKRPDVTVIPVLVAGAQMPDRRDLPPELEAIARRNALELSDRRWRYDVGQLLSALESLGRSGE